MRILEVVHGFPPDAQGGTEVYAEAHARALHRVFGDEILVLTREQNPRAREYAVRDEAVNGLRIVHINNTFRNTRSFEETYSNPEIGAIADRVIDGFRPDVAHIHHLTCLSTSIVRSLANRGIPIFMTLHDYWLMCHRGQLLDVYGQSCRSPGGHGCGACLGAAGAMPPLVFAGAPIFRMIERRCPRSVGQSLRRAADAIAASAAVVNVGAERERRRFAHMRDVCRDVLRFLAPSRYIRDRFIEFGIPANRIDVARYGFDRARFASVDRKHSVPLRIGFIGSLIISKAPHLLLEAFRRLRPGSATIDLFGAFTPYHGDSSYERTLAPLLQSDGIRWRGPVPHDGIPEALAEVDVLVVPSVWPENSPLVIQEAFLAGVPVVAADIGGIPELIVNERGGLLFRPGDTEDLARVLRRLVEEPRLLPALRHAIPVVRSIEEDVSAARGQYLAAAKPRFPTRGRLAAVLLNYRTPDDTLLAALALRASRAPVDDLIVVDNDCGSGLASALAPVLDRITLLETGSNLGFSGGMNVGIRVALARGADEVLLVNSDVVLAPDCIAALHAALDSSPAIGIVGPVIRCRSEPARLESLGMHYSARTGRIRHGGAGLLRGSGDHTSRVTIVAALSGCVMLVRRRVFERIGLLDERYFFSFEDLDFCLRAGDAGFGSAVAEAGTAYHEGGRTIRRGSAREFYFAARNHLLATIGRDSHTGLGVAFRFICVAGLNLAHALGRRPVSAVPARVGAAVRGVIDGLRVDVEPERNAQSSEASRKKHA